MEQNSPGQRQGVSAALAAAEARAAVAASVRFPGEDGGQSLVAMAQRDLDAALQLLADRAQYITGASGAAIAIRRDGCADMLCRASVGTNAPELGALLSTEFGLSGESVRTRQLLRCDDAERDVRVNRDVCRQMGIASVLVMPVVNDDQVLGVFELFSGKTNAFGERDLSAVQRLSEMVETAVRLAQAAENFPDQLADRDTALGDAVRPTVLEGQFLGDLVDEEVKDSEEVPAESITAAALESPELDAIPPAVDDVSKSPEPTKSEPVPQVQAAAVPVIVSTPEQVKKPLFWSAAVASETEAPAGTDPDQSHVPPMLRGLKKCEACGFPISAGRVLCVECEEKKWRGQLRPQSAARKPPTGLAVPASKPAGSSLTAAAPSMAKDPVNPTQSVAEPAPKLAVVTPSAPPVELKRSDPFGLSEETASVTEVAAAAVGAPEFVLSSGIEPAQSWFSANRYIVVVLAALGVVGAAVFLLR